MKTYRAYLITEQNAPADAEEHTVVVWFDGKKTQASDAGMLAYLKHAPTGLHLPDGREVTYSVGEPFFNCIPRVLGHYMRVTPTHVNEKGQEVK